MKYFKSLLTLIISITPTICEPSSPDFILSRKFKVPDGSNAVIQMQTESAIAIVGFINTNVLDTYRNIASKYKVKTLYIDSGGGDVISAIALASDLRRLDARLVVAGKCFSACANYIFAGSLHKNVLPGSLIVIHSTQILYHSKNGDISVAQRDMQKLIDLDSNGSITEQIVEKTRIENDFYYKIGMVRENFRLFDQYQKNLLNASKTKGLECPTYNEWVLSRLELEEMGIKGLEAIWTPRSKEEAALTAKDLGLNPLHVFFGTAKQLIDSCDISNSAATS
jgi:ATP-dependent protease ClpP protease subunit